MGIMSFYHMPKPRQFDRKPIYWDPHKEKLDKRIQTLKQEMGVETSMEDYQSQIKGSFIEGTTHLKRSHERGVDSRTRRYKNVQLALILVLLFGILWFLMQ